MFRIPSVLTSQELLDKSFRRASKARGKGRTYLERAKSSSLAKVESFASTIQSSLSKYVSSFPSVERLDPFFREIIDLLADQNQLKHNLGAVDWARKASMRIAREKKRDIARSRSSKDISARRKEAYGRISSVIEQISPSLKFLVGAREKLKRVPDIDPSLPTIVVAGAPNVGKSLLVRRVSSGKPKIAQYPFTTQSLSVGHFDFKYKRFQVIDTPGLLDRPLEKRNRMERQAISALRHLADIVLFLLDPTGTCGYPLDEQMHLLESIKREFPDVSIIEVENKADLMATGSPLNKVSALTGEGVQELVDLAVREITSRGPEASPPQRAGSHRSPS